MDPSDPSRPVALVTGGGRGIGVAIAASLAEGQYDVILTGRNEHQLATTGRRLGAHWIAGDVTEAGTAAATVEQVIARRGRLDVVVNNAGTAGSGGSASDVDIENWWEVMKVNAYGPMAFIGPISTGSPDASCMFETRSTNCSSQSRRSSPTTSTNSPCTASEVRSIDPGSP